MTPISCEAYRANQTKVNIRFGLANEDVVVNKLFTSVKLTSFELKHRVVQVPLKRMRVAAGNVPKDLLTAYQKRGVFDGGLLITHQTAVSPSGIGHADVPGIFTDEQVRGWRRVANAVHAKGSFIFLRLSGTCTQTHPSSSWGDTPVALPASRAREHADTRYESAYSAESGQLDQREFRPNEIRRIVELLRLAALRAREANFDGVEIDATNGYFFTRFLPDRSNHRNDAIGGATQNRTRLLYEALNAVVGVWGAGRVGVCLSPNTLYKSSSVNDLRSTLESTTLCLNDYDLAYLRLIEPATRGSISTRRKNSVISARDVRRMFKGTLIAAGRFTVARAEQIVRNGDADLVAFEPPSPVLSERLRCDRPSALYDHSIFSSDALDDTEGALLQPNRRRKSVFVALAEG
jgi:N-ethylmaleimide reductase